VVFGWRSANSRFFVLSLFVPINFIYLSIHLSKASASLSVTRFRCADTPERIEVLLEVKTLGDLGNIVFDGSFDLPTDSMRPLPFTLSTCRNVLSEILEQSIYFCCRSVISSQTSR